MALLLAVRPIDLAIFFTLGSLWLFGLGFIVVLYRWILRFDAENDEPDALVPEPVVTPEPTSTKLRAARAEDYGPGRPVGQQA